MTAAMPKRELPREGKNKSENRTRKGGRYWVSLRSRRVEILTSADFELHVLRTDHLHVIHLKHV